MANFIEINFTCEFDKKQCSVFNVLLPKIKQIINNYFFNKTLSIEISINVVDSKKVHSLNKQYRNKDKTTDVLSFPNSSLIFDVFDLGDIFINIEYLNKMENVISKQNLFLDFVVHSFLHLCGFDHKNNFDYEQMELVHKYLIKSVGYNK